MEKHVWGLNRSTPHIKTNRNQSISGGNVEKGWLTRETNDDVPTPPCFSSNNSEVENGLQLQASTFGSLSRGGFQTLISFPAWSGKNSWRNRSISRWGALHRKGQRNSRVVPPFPDSPRCLRPFQGHLFSLHCLDFQAEDRLTPRWHVGQPVGKPRGKASWDSPVG